MLKNYSIEYRTGELLNLRSEKIDVLVVNNAVQDLLAGLKETSLIEWTCAESTLMYDDGKCLFIKLIFSNGFV